MVLVKLYYRPECPKCDELIEALMRLSAEVGFEFEPVLVDSSFEVFYTKDPASKIYSEDWINRFGTKEQKELYQKASPIFEMIHRTTITPVLEITWFYGAGERSVIIQGFSKGEKSDLGLRNIVRAIVQLVNLERNVAFPKSRSS